MLKTTPICLSVYFLTLFWIFFNHVDSQIPDQEQTLLLRLKQLWQNPPALNHWTLTDSSPCDWHEVICNNSSVTALILDNKNIAGTIPPFICDLQNLAILNFSNNRITGRFPTSLYNCTKLESLDLSQNYFAGFLPDDIDNMSRLSYLNIYNNNFTGNIPAAIGRLTELRTLQLHQNLFTGTFPSEIGNLSNLECLSMASNPFLPSRLPSTFTQLKKLKILWISQANLIGEIREMIGNLTALELLDLSTNNLTRKIPSSLFMLKNLSIIHLYQNMFSGEIPRIVEALNLSIIDLSDNNLTGKLSVDFGKLEKLSELHLFFNQLSGEIPESIGRLPALIDVRLFSNNLSGPIPPDFGRYSKLVGFQVSSNRLTGKLPDYLCNGGKLAGVIAFDNNLSGELPESLGNCSSLLIIRISNNEFSGNIPAGLWTGFNMSFIMISDNLFTGELPTAVSSNLSRLEISNNKFSGKIPVGVGSWKNLVIFNASNNQFTGTVPEELTMLPLLTTLLLDRNQLIGALPSDIISWKSLKTLNLSQNHLSGQIPEVIGYLPVLIELDLSNNQFSGQIPPQIGSLGLTLLNFSSNQLTGEIPSEFENIAYATSFENNPGLCAGNSLVNLNPCDDKPQKPSKSSIRLIALLSSLLAVFVLALIVSCVVIGVYWKRKHRSDSKWKLTSFQRLNFTESEILSGLTESNLIGCGGSGKVYRVITNNQDAVAVKRIYNNKLEKNLEKQFLAEVEILSTIRHWNIVKLHCCISNDNSKLIVSEYLENSSLDRWLHKNQRSTTTAPCSVHHVVLDWAKRLNIAAGVAQGLSYLHNHCRPPIIHRDVKTSNILLDTEFNAKIADFGLAKLLIREGESAIASAVAGTFGYIAPEYVQTARVNEKIDIYSFGVVLLELVTGKEAIFGDEKTCLADWALNHAQEGRPIVDAFDEEIKEPSYLAEMSRVFELGIKCTSKQPSDRPSMKEVLHVLDGINSPLGYAGQNLGHDYNAFPLIGTSATWDQDSQTRFFTPERPSNQQDF